MLRSLAFDLHAADRIDRNCRVLLGSALVLAAAAGARDRFRLIMSGVMIMVMMPAVILASLMAGCGPLPLFALRHRVAPPLLNYIP
jgi:hypothetical protein